MYVTKPSANHIITLYRGESPGSVSRLRTYGIEANDRWISSDFPALDWLRLVGLDPEHIVSLGAKPLRFHVNDQLRSPFISFSGRKEPAFRYAFAIGTRQERTEGLLVTMKVHVVKECSWEGIPSWSYGSFVDSEGRSWIYVPGCNFQNIDAISYPQVVDKFHARGRRDDEYLVLGDIDPRELHIEQVTYLRTYQSRTENRQRGWWAGAF